MPSRGLPENIDTGYADDATAPDVKLHQQHHDTIHEFVNDFDDTAPSNGDTLFWNNSTGLWYADAPASGGVGAQGIQGRGFRWLGDWSNATAYTTYNGTTHLNYDVVEQDGASYVCIADHTGSQPPSANWELMADKGADGVIGSDGTDGANGVAGLGNFYIQQDGLAVVTTDSLPLVIPVDMDIVAVTPVSTQPPASVDVELDLFKNGSTLYTVTTPPSIPVGDLVGATTVPDSVALVAGDILSANITAAGPEDGTAAPPTVRTGTGTTSSGASTASTFNVNEPAVHNTGELICCTFVYSTFTISSIPSGWVDIVTGSTTLTPVNGNPAAAFHTATMCWVDDGTSWGTKTVTLSGSGPLLSCTWVLVDGASVATLVDDTTGIETTSSDTPGTNHVLPAVDTTEADEIIVYIYGIKQGSGQGPEAPTLPGGLTTVFNGNTSRVAAVNMGLRIAKLNAPTATNYVSKTATTTGTGYDAGRVLTLTGSGSGGDYPGYDVGLQSRPGRHRPVTMKPQQGKSIRAGYGITGGVIDPPPPVTKPFPRGLCETGGYGQPWYAGAQNGNQPPGTLNPNRASITTKIPGFSSYGVTGNKFLAVPVVVLYVPWHQMQDTAGTTLLPNNTVDVLLQRIQQVRDANPGYDLKAILRINAGQFSPQFAMNYGGGPMWVEDHFDNKTNFCPIWWNPQFQAAYANLQIALANAYDNNPLVGATTVTSCHIFYPEPYILSLGQTPTMADGVSTGQRLVANGFNATVQENAILTAMDAHTVWQKTCSMMAFNPWQGITANGGATAATGTKTAQHMATFRDKLGPLAVLSNDSVRKNLQPYPNGPVGGPQPYNEYEKVYQAMATLGPPAACQTARKARLCVVTPPSTYDAAAACWDDAKASGGVLDWCSTYGPDAGLAGNSYIVEMIDTWATEADWTLAKMQAYTARMVAAT